MALFVVNLMVDVVVSAEDKADATRVAVRNLADIADDDFGAFVVREVHSEEDLPDGWDLDDRPLGNIRAIYKHLDEGAET